MKELFVLAAMVFAAGQAGAAEAPVRRAMQFRAGTVEAAAAWQRDAREQLIHLMMGGKVPPRVPPDPRVTGQWDAVPGATGYRLEEATIQTLPDRRVHLWLARPKSPGGRVGAVLALHGHGGSGEAVVRGQGLYWYGRTLAEMGLVVVAPDIGQHELQHADWTLMGERTWDALRCLDYMTALPEVDPARIAVAGLSLGGETAMYVAALDERVRLACSSGWLTTVANMKNGHCPCFDFPGLEATFDFADIFACAAPRGMVCELGEQERAPGGFPVAIGRSAHAEVAAAYRLFGAESNLTLTVHSGPHVFSGRDFLPRLRSAFGVNVPAVPEDAAARAWVRFTDGPESFEGSAYHWLGRSVLEVTLDTPPEPGDALELRWGAKSDRRQAVIRVNGRSSVVEEGGHWGFRWVRVPIPAGVQGDRYRIRFERGQGLPAFLAEVRVAGLERPADRPELSRSRHRADLTVSGVDETAAGAEAFPAMRAVWDREPAAAAFPAVAEGVKAAFRQAERNGRMASEALYRCRRYVDGWLARADPATGLIPRNLRESDFWNGRDAAADNYPYMVLTAAMTDRGLLEGRMLEMLRTETRLTCRLGRLPDDYSFSKKGWRREALDVEQVMFDGAEYVKDGLLCVTEWLGASPWSERMIGIVDDLWAQASLETPYGKLPSLNLEIAGNLLQANSRLFWFTGNSQYLDQAIRLGDYYLLGTNHPTRDFRTLRLVDHGCEILNGLSELYVAVAHARPAKKQAYQEPLHAVFDCVLEKGRNADGLLYSWFNPQTGEHSADLCDTWGYDYDGVYALWLIDRTPAYREAVRKVLGNLEGKYVGACWGDRSADGFADSIEGALNLYHREPVASAAAWIDDQTRRMWRIQGADGVIEGWHGDGNFARTSLMVALWKSQGARVEPWRTDVRCGAVREGNRLYLHVTADGPWEGRLVFDRPRHRRHLKLPLDYPRINQFPEWFAVEEAGRYTVRQLPESPREWTGAQLAEGIPLRLRAGHAVSFEVR
ncbi:MAG TPA: alpha/beta hydrolase family protein [Verrucomicrobiota bacterium]|nr:alpha/beta hydrolase family protein [Verrucomicrobiota bacterium]HNU50782.1 alpha/beta hydrolase family protein [Verrucomicrobiota bacterium]